MKQISIFLLLSLLSCAFLNSSCDPFLNDYVMVHNQSSEPIVVYTLHTNGVRESDDEHFWTRAIRHDPEIIAPGDSKEVDFLEMVSGLTMIIFKKSSFDQRSVEENMQLRLYDELKHYSYSQMKAMNFQLVYTGDEE